MRLAASLLGAWLLGPLLLAGPARAEVPDDAVVARWIQFAPNPTDPARPEPIILARALTTAAACPSLAIDGQPAAMTVRFPADPPTDAMPMPVGVFPITECEATVPPGHTRASVGGVDLRLPVAHPRRILVLADTGCRMNGAAQQDCQDPVAFPLGLLATYETQFHPDLIVHVGDYFYRDTGCPDGSTPATCPNTRTQWGDNWASWTGDFFGPAKALLAEAPWVMTRGNHESCGRGAHGWFHLLDPRPYDPAAPACAKGSAWDFSPTYVVPAGAVDVLVHDSSFANDMKVDEPTAKRYETDLRHVLDTLGDAAPPLIFMTHKPTYGLVRGEPDSAGNDTEQYLFDGLFGGTVPKPIALFLSGHIHQAQYVNFRDSTKFAPQLIVGVGGSMLDASILATSTRYELAPGTRFDFMDGPTSRSSAPITGGHAQAEFGFAVLDATDTGFLARVYSLSGQQSGRCVITLTPRRLDCAF
jgi:hypothetical protein